MTKYCYFNLDRDQIANDQIPFASYQIVVTKKKSAQLSL